MEVWIKLCSYFCNGELSFRLWAKHVFADAIAKVLALSQGQAVLVKQRWLSR